MNAAINSDWGSLSRLRAAEKFKAKSAAMGRDVTEALVDYAAPRSGMKVLDLASGTGEPAITLAARIGASGHVTALDLSADLLAIAADCARQRGLQNITTQQGDAQQLPFGDNQFDLATSRFGVMFFADVDRALGELHRVLRPKACACFVVWGPPEQPHFSASFGTVHRHIGGPLLTPGGINPFRFARPSSLSEAFIKNGFAKVHEETRTVPWTWTGTAEEVWEMEQAVGAAFQPLLKRVPAEKWPEIHAEVLAAIRQYEDQGSIKFGATIILASGEKP